MKTFTRIVSILILVAVLTTMSGCYGSFVLTQKLYNWNGSLGNKWINTIVMWILLWLPAYEATSFIDFVVLNTVEFWTGTNPMAMEQGVTDVKYASSGEKVYKISTSQNEINIMETAGPDKGKAITLTYTPESGTWTMNDGKASTLIAKLSSKDIRFMYPNGMSKTVAIPR